MPLSINWSLAGNVVFSGIVIVFVILVILILAVMLMGKIFSSLGGKKPADSPKTPVTAPAPVKNITSSGDETVAVIAAAVSAYMDETAPGTPYRIASIAPRQSANESRPAWGFAGMRQNTEPF